MAPPTRVNPGKLELLDTEMSDTDENRHPALHPDITNVPVTPGVQLTGRSAYLEGTGDEQAHGASSPAVGTDGAQTGRTPLNTSDTTGKSDLEDVDPRAANPALNLSGRIISATFAVPYSVKYSPGQDWELSPRRGTSALFDSFSYLSSPSSSWNHLLVGWTGEISRVQKNSASKVQIPTNKAAAPIPVDPSQPIQIPQPPANLRISRQDRERLEKQLEQDHGGKVVPVWLVDETDEAKDEYVLKIQSQSRWRTYAEHELYTIFHYKQNEPTDGRAARESWDDYCRMNKLFADRILEIYKPGDIIVVHDFYLLLLPSLLRQRLPSIYIGFFLHIPFPSSEFYRCLSTRKEVLEGVLGANMVGFQSFSYSRHFSSCCTRILGFNSSAAGVEAYGNSVAVDVFPLGINASSTQRQAFENPEIDEKIKGIREMYAGTKIIVGRDRLDAVRGVVQKLQAFEMFLKKYPEWQGKVVLIQVTGSNSVHTDKGDGAQEKVVNTISELAAKINGQYGSLDFSPVRHFPQYLSPEEYFALLRIADIGLITSVRDGMNTVSMEYVICQQEHHGPLILSEFSGTSGSLTDAIHINPWDLGGVADAINDALTLSPEERADQHAKLYNHVLANNVQSWPKKFLKKLIVELSSVDQTSATPALDSAKVLSQYRQAKKRLFMFDYDGTLTPIVQDPSAAIPSDRVIRTLKTLAADPANCVWIISGRDQAFLDEWMGHISELGLSAEHGCFMRRPRSETWENLAEKSDMSWQEEVIDVFQHWTDVTQGSFIERKKVAVTWHYRRAVYELGLQNSRECQRELERTVAMKHDVDIMTGKANVEVRPKFVNKGEIAKMLVLDYGDGPGQAPEFVLCMGDDFTDEDMFRALRASKLENDHVFSVTVGPSSKQTLANWHLLEPSDVIQVLSLLNGSPDQGSVAVAAAAEGSVPKSRTG